MSEQLELFHSELCCAFCGKHTYNALYVTKHIGVSSVQIPFCGEAHANEYYLEKLREREGGQ